MVNVPTTANQITGIEKANYHKILIFSPTTSLKSLHAARIDQLADSNEPAIMADGEVGESWEELEDSGVSNLFYLMKNIPMNLQLQHKNR